MISFYFKENLFYIAAYRLQKKQGATPEAMTSLCIQPQTCFIE